MASNTRRVAAAAGAAGAGGGAGGGEARAVGGLQYQLYSKEDHVLLQLPLDEALLAAVYRARPIHDVMTGFARRRTGPMDTDKKASRPRFRVVVRIPRTKMRQGAVMTPNGNLAKWEKTALNFDQSIETYSDFFSSVGDDRFDLESEESALATIAFVGWCHVPKKAKVVVDQVMIAVISFTTNEFGIWTHHMKATKKYCYTRNLFGANCDGKTFTCDEMQRPIHQFLLLTLYQLREQECFAGCSATEFWSLLEDYSDVRHYLSVGFHPVYENLPPFLKEEKVSRCVPMLLEDMFGHSSLERARRAHESEDQMYPVLLNQLTFFKCCSGSKCIDPDSPLKECRLCIYCCGFVHKQCSKSALLADYQVQRLVLPQLPSMLQSASAFETYTPMYQVCLECFERKKVSTLCCINNEIFDPLRILPNCLGDTSQIHLNHVCYKCRCLVHVRCAWGYVPLQPGEMSRLRWKRLPVCKDCMDMEKTFYKDGCLQRSIEESYYMNGPNALKSKIKFDVRILEETYNGVNYVMNCQACQTCHAEHETSPFLLSLLYKKEAFELLRNENSPWTFGVMSTYILLLRHHMHTKWKDHRVLSYYLNYTSLVHKYSRRRRYTRLSFQPCEALPPRITRALLLIDHSKFEEDYDPYSPGHWTVVCVDIPDQCVTVYTGRGLLSEDHRLAMQHFVKCFLWAKMLLDISSEDYGQVVQTEEYALLTDHDDREKKYLAEKVPFVTILDGNLEGFKEEEARRGPQRWYWVEQNPGLQGVNDEVGEDGLVKMKLDSGAIACLVVKSLFCKGFNPMLVPPGKWRTLILYELLKMQTEYQEDFACVRFMGQNLKARFNKIRRKNVMDAKEWFGPFLKKVVRKKLKSSLQYGYSVSRPCSPLVFHDNAVPTHVSGGNPYNFQEDPGTEEEEEEEVKDDDGVEQDVVVSAASEEDESSNDDEPDMVAEELVMDPLPPSVVTLGVNDEVLPSPYSEARLDVVTEDGVGKGVPAAAAAAAADANTAVPLVEEGSQLQGDDDGNAVDNVEESAVGGGLEVAINRESMITESQDDDASIPLAPDETTDIPQVTAEEGPDMIAEENENDVTANEDSIPREGSTAVSSPSRTPVEFAGVPDFLTDLAPADLARIAHDPGEFARLALALSTFERQLTRPTSASPATCPVVACAPEAVAAPLAAAPPAAAAAAAHAASPAPAPQAAATPSPQAATTPLAVAAPTAAPVAVGAASDASTGGPLMATAALTVGGREGSTEAPTDEADEADEADALPRVKYGPFHIPILTLEEMNETFAHIRLEDGDTPLTVEESRECLENNYTAENGVSKKDMADFQYLQTFSRQDPSEPLQDYDVVCASNAFDQIAKMKYEKKTDKIGPKWLGQLKDSDIWHEYDFRWIQSNFDIRFWMSVRASPFQEFHVPIGNSKEVEESEDDDDDYTEEVAQEEESITYHEVELRVRCPEVWRIQKKGEESCLLASFASALKYIGQYEAANQVNSAIPQSLHSPTSWEFMLKVGNRFVKKLAAIKKFQDGQFKILEDICEDPTVCLLCSRDGNVQHAITLVGTWIFDSNRTKALVLSQESLNWCCDKSGGFLRVTRAARFYLGKKVGAGRTRKRKKKQQGGPGSNPPPPCSRGKDPIS